MALVSIAAAGCSREGAAAAGAAGTAAAAQPAPKVAPPLDEPAAEPPSTAPLPRPPTHGCRVVSARGSAQRGSGAEVRAGDRFSGADWLELGKDTRLHLKHGDSGREWTLRGPARVLPCVDGREELIVAEGELRAEPGTGVRPGAQVLIGTPFGSVRYGDASALLTVSAEALQLTVSTGDTWLRAGAAADAAETLVTPAKGARRGKGERLQASAAVAECERAARASEALARSLLEPAAPKLGERAAEHVRARERARARCADATAAVLQQESGSEREQRLSQLAALRELWQRVPALGG